MKITTLALTLWLAAACAVDDEPTTATDTAELVGLFCFAADDCGSDAYCAGPRGTCGDWGVCAPRPDFCTLEYVPVCGCDGQTYANECEANAAGATVAVEGACDAPPSCTTNAECSDGQFCQGTGLSCGEPGYCAERPEACTREFVPVCGCDGQTYANECEARRAGATVASEGECAAPPTCVTGDECGAAEYCERPGTSCRHVGECVPRPEICTQDFNPVCGCDGVTYANECEANAAGTTAVSLGACDSN